MYLCVDNTRERREAILSQLISFARNETMASFPSLFRPLQVGTKHVLKNRAIMGSMHVGMEDSPPSLNPFSKPPPLDELAAFYRERSKNNCALIVTGT